MVRYKQLPEWREKRLSRLPDPYTADSVPNSQKLNEKKRLLRMLEGFLDSRGDCGAYCLKLVPFACRTDARNVLPGGRLWLILPRMAASTSCIGRGRLAAVAECLVGALLPIGQSRVGSVRARQLVDGTIPP
jgi:hypothetical protein